MRAIAEFKTLHALGPSGSARSGRGTAMAGGPAVVPPSPSRRIGGADPGDQESAPRFPRSREVVTRGRF